MGAISEQGAEWKRKSQHKNKQGYLAVWLRRDVGKGVHRRVHTLVMLAFVGPPSDKLEVCHNDGRRDNNVLANLRYDTRSANARDKALHGTAQIGERHPRARITEDDVRSIRARRAAGEKLKKIGESYGMSESVIHLIVNRYTWKCVA